MASAMEKLQLQLSRFVYGSIVYVSAESLSPCFGVPEDFMAQNIGPYSEDFYWYKWKALLKDEESRLDLSNIIFRF